MLSSPSAAIVGNPIINNSDTPDGTIFEYSSGGGTTVSIDDTGGDPNVFDDDDTGGHVVSDGGGIVADGTPVESESLIFLQALDENGDPTGPTITATVFSQNGITGDVWGFATDTPLVDGVNYIKTGGSNLGDAEYASFITCFGEGTQLLTENGLRQVEYISKGDRIWTNGNGFKPVQWVGHAQVDAEGPYAPIVFAAGTIGNSNELTLSQEHRVLIDGPDVELHFGEPAVLVAAKHMCGLPGIDMRPGGRIRYFHLMFDQHEVVSANGALCESFFLSSLALSGVEAEQRRELLDLFPSLGKAVHAFGKTAALTLKSHEAQLVLRQIMNKAA
ncbi:MAG: Hint domain-containing protein [Pseudomonadota bacterium]